MTATVLRNAMSRRAADTTLPPDVLAKADIPQMIQDAFQTHFALLLRWNKVHNLTRVTNASDAAYKHYLDSWLGVIEAEKLLARLRTAKPSDNTSAMAWTKGVYDIGSGAGFPGVVCALRWTDTTVTWVEPSSKRVSFLQRIKQELQLDHVVVHQGRLQDLDVAPGSLLVSRATFPWEDWQTHLLEHPGCHAALWCGVEPTATQWGQLVTDVSTKLNDVALTAGQAEVVLPKKADAAHRQVLCAHAT